MSSYPKFAVIGHPNKGKSSIVASLALDDTIAISDTPGTTTKYRSFPLVVDGKVLYELFDTPGFQRARKIMRWLKSAGDLSATQKVQRLREFVREYENDPRFNDDIELLKPILDGAGILYIVDASKPYGSEYEIQMEILSYTGMPSMAILNHIGDDDYSDEWKSVLHHYFKMVRTYNPMSATIQEHISILESIAQLREEWTPSIKESIEAFREYHKSNIQKSSDAIISYIKDSLGFVLEVKSGDISKDDAIIKYQDELRDKERELYKKLEDIWQHRHLKKSSSMLEFEEMDLFSTKSISLFGLTQKDIILMGMGSGAITGASIDMISVGHTLLLGGVVGAIVGGVGAYLGFDKVANTKVLGSKISQEYIHVGPMTNKNFPYIILGRAIFYALTLRDLSHAKRDIIEIDINESFTKKWLNDDNKKIFEKYHQLLRKGKNIPIEIEEEYLESISKILTDT